MGQMTLSKVGCNLRQTKTDFKSLIHFGTVFVCISKVKWPFIYFVLFCGCIITGKQPICFYITQYSKIFTKRKMSNVNHIIHI